ncbi:MAG: hypothetical protein K2N73_10590 [Lachnospiraceae bacterium]|nr:hypothetical protein [Lachnospiraceae bacterium]
MAEYDGSIRINTKIDSKQASAQLMSLENRIVKTADKVASLRSKMDALKNAQVPTQEYKDISAQIEKAEREFDKLLEKQEQMQREGKDHGVAWDRLNQKMEEIGNTINYAKGELRDLVDSGKAFTLGSESQEYANLGQQLQYAENDLSALTRRHDELIERQNRTANGYKELKKSIQKFGSLGKSILSLMQKSVKKIESGFKKLGDTAKKSFTKVNKSANGTNNIFQTGLKNILKYGLGIRSMYVLINKLRTAIKEGFSNLYNDKNMASFKAQVDSLKASLLTLKNSFAAAFRPLVEIAIPYIQLLIDYMIQLLNVVGQFMASITGQDKYTRAVKQTTAAIEEQNKAQKKQLSNLDNLNNLTSDNGSGGKDTTGMFEEVPIESGIENIANKVKDILSRFFEPLKKAWKSQGKSVMDAWKHAIKEIGKLLKSVGSDFLEVWQQQKTVQIFKDILQIIKDIGLAIGHLAENFRKAWEENDTGLRIFENIRDIIGVIIANVKRAADVTVDWAKNLNFTPLLEAVERFTNSLEPVMDALSGILTDFYEQVMLPLGKWALEKGLPKLLDVFTAFNEKVDWNALRENFSELWEHLEPFAETVGEGLIIFIERISDLVANFLNSETFMNFLNDLGSWMDSVTPEDVADGIEKFVKALIGLKFVLLGLTALKGIAEFTVSMVNLGNAIGSIGSLSGVASAIGGFLTADIGTLAAGGSLATLGATIGTAIIGGIVAAIAGWNFGQFLYEKITGEEIEMSFTEQVKEIFSSFTDGSWVEAFKLWGSDIVEGLKAGITDAFSAIGSWIDEHIFKPFVNGFKKLFGIHSPSTVMAGMGNNIVEGLLNGLKEKWKSVVSWITEKINWLKDKLNGITGKITYVFTGGGDSKNKSTVFSTRAANVSTTPYNANSAFSALNITPIPKLALGAVIPANREFLAVLGDQKHGTNIEAPLSTIEEAVINAIAKVNANSGNNNSGSITLEIPVVIKGIGEIGRAVQQFDREFFKQSGKHAFT